MKKRIWLLAMLLCLALCVIGTAMADGPEVNTDRVSLSADPAAGTLDIWTHMRFQVNAVYDTGESDENGNPIRKTADEVILFVHDDGEDAGDRTMDWHSGTDEDGNAEFEWDINCNVTVYAQARYHYDDDNGGWDEWYQSNQVVFSLNENIGQIDGEISIAEEEFAEEGYCPSFSREERLSLTVNRIEDVNYFGVKLCPLGANSGDSAADSGWVPQNDIEGGTPVSLPLSGCAAGKTYDIYVYAIQIGCEYKEEQVGSLRVTRAYTDQDLVITNLKDPEQESYAVGEPLQLAAYYEINETLENAYLAVRIFPATGELDENGYPMFDEERPVYDERRDMGPDRDNETTGYEFRDNEFSVWTEGEYQLFVAVCQDVQDEDENRIACDTRTFRVESEHGNLEGLDEYAPVGPEPYYLPAQENYTLTVTAPGDAAEWYDVEVYDNDGYNSFSCAWEYGVNAKDDTKLTFNTWENHSYRVAVRAYRNGYNEFCRETSEIPALNIDENQNRVTLSLESGELGYVNEDFTVVVTAPGAAWIELYDSNSGLRPFQRWDYDPEWPEEYTLETSCQTGMDTTYRIWAVAAFYDDNDEVPEEDKWFFVTTQPRTFELLNTGESIHPFSVFFEQTEADTLTVPRGTAVDVVFEEATWGDENDGGEASNYMLDVWTDTEENEPEWEFDWRIAQKDREQRVMTVFTAGMPAGRYKLIGIASQPGYGDYRTEDAPLYLEIVEPEEDDPGILFTILNPESDFTTGEDIFWSAYAEGADSIQVFFRWPNEERDRRDYNGDCWMDSYRYWEAGTYQVAAAAWIPETEDGEPVYEDEPDENGNLIPKYRQIYSESMEITVRTAEGNEDSLAEAMAQKIPDNIPPYLDWKEGSEGWIALEIEKPDNIEKAVVSVDVSVMNPDGTWWDQPLAQADTNNAEGKATIELTHAQLEEYDIREDHILAVNIYASAEGYNAWSWQKFIPVVAEPDGNDQQVYLSFVDDHGEPTWEAATVTVNEGKGLVVGVNSEDAQEDQPEIRQVCVFDGRWFGDNHDRNDSVRNLYYDSVSFSEPGTYTVYARVDLDGNWVTTNMVRITVTPAEKAAGEFEIRLDSTEVDRGEKIQVTFTESKNATDYWLNQNCGLDWRWVDEENRITEFSTLHLSPGKYVISGGAGGVGILNAETREVAFTVNPMDESLLDEETGIYFEIGKDTVKIGEPLEVGIYAPGAMRVGFVQDGQEWHFDENGRYCWGDGDTWVDYDRVIWENRDDAGEHELKAAAEFENIGWVYDTKTVMVECDGSLDFDLSGLPVYLTEGEAAEIAVPLPEHAERMNVRVYESWQEVPNDQEDDGWRREPIGEEYENLGENLKMNLTADQLTAGHWIELEADASAVGYEGTGKSASIPVIGKHEAADGATIAVATYNEASQEITYDYGDNGGVIGVFKDDDIEFRIIPAENCAIDAVKFYDGYGYWEDGEKITPHNHGDWFEDGCFVAGKRYDDSGRYPVYALVRLEGSDNWITTNVLTMEVGAKGQLAGFGLAAGYEPQQYAERGSYATVSFAVPDLNEHVPASEEYILTENDYYFWVDVCIANEEGNPGEYIENLETMYCGIQNGVAEVRVPTAGLNDGEYLLHGRMSVHNWEIGDCTEDVLLHIGSPEEPVLFLANNPIDACTPLEASFYAPGASRIWIQMDEADDLESRRNVEAWEGDGWTSDENWMFTDAGEHYVVGWAYYEDHDENWDGWTCTERQYVWVNADGRIGEFNTVDIPAFMMANYGFGFHLNLPEGAEWMSAQVSLIRIEENQENPGQPIDVSYELEMSDRRIGGEGFGFGFADADEYAEYYPGKPYPAAGDRLSITYQAYAYGKEACMGGMQIPVIGEAPESAPDVLGVDGLEMEIRQFEDGEEYEFWYGWTGMPYRVVIKANDEAGIRFFNGYNFDEYNQESSEYKEEYVWDDETIPVYIIEVGFADSGNYMLYATAVDDQGDEIAGNPWELTILGSGSATVPEGIAVSGNPEGDEPEGLASRLTINCGDMPYLFLPAPVDENSWYDVYFSMQDNEEPVYTLDGRTEAGRVRLCQSGNNEDEEDDTPLDPGTYYLSIRYRAQGMESASINCTVVVQGQGITLTTASGRRIFRYGDDIEFRVEAPGKELNDIEWTVTRNDRTFTVNDPDENHGWPWINADVITTPEEEGQEETGITVKASVVYGDDPEQTAEAEMTIYVRSRGVPEMPWIGCANWIFDSRDGLVIDVSHVPDGVWYTLKLVNAENDIWNLTASHLKAETSYTVQGNTLQSAVAEVQTGLECTLIVNYGYEENDPDPDHQGWDTGEWTWRVDVWHEYEPKFTWDKQDGQVICNVQKICKNCNKIQCLDEENNTYKAACQVDEIYRQEATCMRPGSVTYKAWIQLNDEEYYEEEQTFETDPELGHDYDEGGFDWFEERDGNGQLTDISAKFHHRCNRCGYEEWPETSVEEDPNERADATCTEGYHAKWTASALDGEKTDERYVDTDPLGHDWNEWAGQEATCEHTGHLEADCTREGCDAHREKNTEKQPHDWLPLTYNWEDTDGDGVIDFVTVARRCRYDDRSNPTHKEEEGVIVIRELETAPTENTAGTVRLIPGWLENPHLEEQKESQTETIPALSELQVLRLPALLTTIEEEAFANAACQAIIVPETCEWIGDNAFAGCTRLMYVKFEGNTNFAESAFDGCPQVVLDVPEEP